MLDDATNGVRNDATNEHHKASRRGWRPIQTSSHGKDVSVCMQARHATA